MTPRPGQLRLPAALARPPTVGEGTRDMALTL